MNKDQAHNFFLLISLRKSCLPKL